MNRKLDEIHPKVIYVSPKHSAIKNKRTSDNKYDTSNAAKRLSSTIVVNSSVSEGMLFGGTGGNSNCCFADALDRKEDRR